MKLHIKTVTGVEFDVQGEEYSFIDGIHYLNGSSYPDEIVTEVEDEKDV